MEKEKEGLSPTGLYNTYSHQIEVQEDHINQRVMWLIIAQSFFFLGYATILNLPADTSRPEVLQTIHNVMVWIIPVSGFITCAAVFLSILISILAITGMRKKYYDVRETNLPSLPPLQAERMERVTGLAGPIILPVIFILTWLYLFILVMSI
jgi:hypothetical protein